MTRIEALKIITTARASEKIPDLTGANLTRANLRGADLRGAKVKNVTWPFFISGDADLTGAK